METSQEQREQRNYQSTLGFKVSHVFSSLLVLWLTATHLIGILSFAKGFLLTRLVLDNKSSCIILPDGTASSAQNGCWHPRKFDKAVVILIDALRYDFTVPFQSSQNQPEPGFYHDALSFLYETASQSPENAFLLPFIADPPTTTLQRLKGLTTGSLPTFIEAGTNFAGSAIDEDNIVSQLRGAGKRVVHLGDDTWHALFPDHFDPNLTHPYDSFNVRDLHTVDNGVMTHLFPDLEHPMIDSWDVIFAHFLGVDHAGHRYGPEHLEMCRKLRQMDEVIRNVTQMIGDDTLLIVMGDHGMDSKGDHGGESDEEVEAALWMYSKTRTFGRLDPAHTIPPASAKDRPVRQIDLVSTFSLLMGLPIPFNNLGRPITEAFVGGGHPDFRNLAEVNLLTVQQIERYQDEYSKQKPLERTQEQLHKHSAISHALEEQTPTKWQHVYENCQNWQTETLNMYRSLWANFNVSDMINGVAITSIGTLGLLLLSRNLRPDVIQLLPHILRSVGSGIGVGTFLGSVLYRLFPSYFTAVSAVFCGSGMGSLLGLISALYQHRIYLTPPVPSSFWSWACVLFTISQAAGFAANSFTIHEDTILLLFLTTFGFLACISSFRQESKSDRILGIYHSILFLLQTRLASVSRLCREEQMPGCRSTFYASSTSSTTVPWQLGIPVAVAIVLPEIIKAFYKGTASYEGSASFWLGFCFRVGLLSVAAVWTVEAAENGNWLEDYFTEETLKTSRILLARGVMAIALPVGIATFVWAKPCINILLRDRTTASNDPSNQPRPQLTILGYANVQGTRYALLLPLLALLICLTLPPMGQLSTGLLTWQIFSLLEILDTNGLIPYPSDPRSYTVGPTILAMLGSYHFFKTGHTATLASIQWTSPFIALRSLSYPWSPLLVLLNTFGSQILCAAAVPLTVLWKRPVNSYRFNSTRASGLAGLWSPMTSALLTHVLYFATIALATTLWAGHLRRHLMLYRVFMPRYLMANLVLLVVDLVVLTVALPAVLVTGLSVGEVFGF